MKPRIILISIALIFSLTVCEHLHAQAGFSPKVDSVINLCTDPILSKLIRELSGDTATVIGGLPYTIVSRHSSTVHNPKAAQFIYERFQNFGLNAQYMNYRTNGTNVYVKKLGTKYPGRQYIICAHYDDMPSGSLAPGADDNASGTCAVIEAARLCAPLSFDYTLIFIAFDEEEQGLIGSKAYADSAFNRGDTILGVINLDMISFDANHDYQINIRSNTNSLPLCFSTKNIFYLYQPALVPFIVMNTASSDHASFWNRGYKAICGIQQRSETNQYYHTVNDNFSIVWMPYYLSYTRAAIAALLSFGWDYLMEFIHAPITSASHQTPVNATVIIRSPHPVAKGTNGPRLYYRVNSGTFSYVNFNYNNLDTFRFTIPGQNAGSSVSYYIAAQDTLGRFIATYPAGGRGLNPPGTTAPDTFFTYSVVTGIASNNEPVKYELEQNYPNPFNPATNIAFTLAKASGVRIVIYDVLGREVSELINNRLNYGKHVFRFEADNLSSGIYYYSMYIEGSLFNTKKMTLVK